MPYFPIKTYLCDIDICKTKVDNSEKIFMFRLNMENPSRMRRDWVGLNGLFCHDAHVGFRIAQDEATGFGEH